MRPSPAITRLLLRWTLLLSGLFLLPLLLIRAQPDDDSDLRSLLMPEGCPAPCLMGIRPGVTTSQEAVAILEAHDWVGEIDYRYYDPQRLHSNLLSWHWSGRQPAVIDASRAGSIELAEWGGSGIQKVAEMSIATHITFAELVLAAGPPTASWFAYDSFGVFRDLNSHAAVFGQRAFRVSTRVQCPLSLQSLAYQPVSRFSFRRPDQHDAQYASPVSIGRPSEYFAQYFLRRPFPRYSARELRQFPGC